MPMPMVTVRYWAAARAAAGVDEERYDAATVADVLAAARRGRDERFARVLAVCSILVDGEPVGAREHAAVRVPEGATVELLPPFAGG
jgi:molybdopterin converting factor small subunit